MSSDHSHQHHHRTGGSDNRRQHTRRLGITLVLIAAYMVAEVIGGLLSNSLALLADAGHMLSDVAALTISLAAIWAAGLPATSDHTYGYHRAEVLGAMINAVALIFVAGWIVSEAFERFAAPPDVAAPLALGVASGGLGVNLIALWLLHSSREESLNVRGAWLHVIGDTLGSLGAISSALLIWTLGWRWADPAASLLIAALVVYSALTLLKQVVDVLMERSPQHIEVGEMRDSIAALHEVQAVHDLHVWTITSGLYALTGHIVVDPVVDSHALLQEVRSMLGDRYGIDHMTIQIESPDFEENNVCH